MNDAGAVTKTHVPQQTIQYMASQNDATTNNPTYGISCFYAARIGGVMG